MPDGRDAMSIGDMKDAITTLERDKQQSEELRMAMVKQETELNQYMAQSGIEVPQDFARHMQAKQSEYLETQHTLMMKMMPEMAEKPAFDKMREGILKVAKGSNFTEAEIAKVSDARVVHLMHRLATLEAKQEKASQKVEQIKKATKPRGKSRRNEGGTSKIDRQYTAALNGSQADKNAAIDALLSG